MTEIAVTYGNAGSDPYVSSDCEVADGEISGLAPRKSSVYESRGLCSSRIGNPDPNLFFEHKASAQA